MTPTSLSNLKIFASDNNAGAHPKVLEAMIAVNGGYVKSYGDDHWTEEATAALKNAFGSNADPYFVYTGTAANVLGLKSMIRSYHSIICTDHAHIHTDECGSPEAVIGSKLLAMPSYNGKIDLHACEAQLRFRETLHHAYPRVLSITQLTECGTSYSLNELKEIGTFCKKHDLYFHMDGARLANAAGYLGLDLKTITADVGVDALSFGGAKNGLLFGEAVIFFNKDFGHEFCFYRKQNMHLGSKMRFVAAQFLAYLNDSLWRKNAEYANSCALELATGINSLQNAKIIFPVEGNAIFARMQKDAIKELQKDFYFYTIDTTPDPNFPPDWHLIRLMTAFNTPKEHIPLFIEAMQRCVG